MNSARIYGFTADYGSYAQVTRGFAEAFRAHGYGTDRLDVVSLETEITFDEEPTGLPLADVGILTGPPVAASKMVQGAMHERRYVMVAPNSNKLPERMMHTVNSFATAILAPSGWAATVLSQYTTKPVIVVPHGVSAEYRPAEPMVDLEALYADGEFRVLHLSSSDGQRKGTIELVRAFLLAVRKRELPERSELRLVLTPRGLGQMTDVLADLVTEDPRVRECVGRVKMMGRFGAHGAPPAMMSEIYSAVHLVAQPSRGEGFGMVPLEALASGAPIIATTCTGHHQWFIKDLPGAVPIATGAPAPIDDMPSALAPKLLVADVQAALVRAYSEWHDLKSQALENATAVSAYWQWGRQLDSFIEHVVL